MFNNNKNNNTLVIVLISVLVLLLGYRFAEKAGLIWNRNLRRALVWAKKDSLRVADSLKKNLAYNTLIEKSRKDSVVLQKKEETYKTCTYYIIVGSFSIPENARLKLKEYQVKGYQPKIINAESRQGMKLELVYIRSFTDYNEAGTFLKEFQKLCPSSWLYNK